MNYMKFKFQCPSVKCPSLEHSHDHTCSMTAFLLQQQSRMVEIHLALCKKKKKKKSLPIHHLQKSKSPMALIQVNIYQD